MVTKRLTKETATGGEIRMTTEELVKQICKEQGMSVAKLAAALGQSRQNFYKKLQRDTLTAQEWQEAAKVLGVEFDQGFVLPDGTRLGVSGKREKRTVLPLMGSAFSPGKAEETVEQFEDPELREIARGELCFFRAQAESCIQCVEKYQTSEDPMLRLSADMLSTFANFTLGNAKEAQMAREDVSQILKEHLKKEEDPDMIASCLFAVYVTSVLIHIPPEGGNAATGSLSFVPSGRAAVVCNHVCWGMPLSERRVCQSTGHGADGDGNDGKDLSDPDDLPALCVCHVPRSTRKIRRAQGNRYPKAGRWREKINLWSRLSNTTDCYRGFSKRV